MGRYYFVTGASGAVGSEVVRLLLDDPENRIWILLRAQSSEHLDERFNDLIAYYALSKAEEEDARSRIFPVMGDMDLDQFAIDSKQYEEITQQCMHIIHCAGVVRMNLPIEVARQHAVDSARNVIELALACKSHGSLEKIDIVSTVGVAGRMRENVPEDWLDEPRAFHNTYEESKAEAEDYIKKEMDKHQLPITIHRPSMVVGHAQTGKIIHFQVFYYLSEFLVGRTTFGLFPFLGAATLDTVPVDYVAGVIKWSSEQKATVGKIFHLSAGPQNALKLAALQPQIREIYKQNNVKLPALITLPPVIFSFMLKIIALFLSQKAKSPLKVVPIFLDYSSGRQLFTNTQTLDFIKEHGGPELPLPLDYIQTVLTYYLQKKRQDRPA